MVSVSVVVVPEAVLRSNQAALSLSVQDKVPPPILVSANGFADGFAPPTVPEKAKFVGREPIVPFAAARVRVTGMVLVVAPIAATVMVAVRVPAVNPVRFTLAVTVPLLVPETGRSEERRVGKEGI